MWARTQLLLVLVATIPLHAQDAMPRLSAEVLYQWFRSGDPRLIAWAAHYEGQYGDGAYPGTMAVMAEVLDKERTSPDRNALTPEASEHDHNEAEAAVLDAFIQQKAPPPPAIIATVADRFPAQAALLASYLPLSERRPLLEGWYGLRNYDASGRLLARLSTLLLADAPSSALVASLVDEAEEHLTIVLQRSPATDNSGIGVGACDDFLAKPVRDDWPVVYTYQLQENAAKTTGILLVALAKDRITYRRMADNAPEGSCNGVRPLTPATRHELIAYWLGVPERELSWSIEETSILPWTTREAYLAALARSIQQHIQALQDTVQSLVAKKFLNMHQAETVQPRLLLSFYCEINPCPLGSPTTHPHINTMP